MFLGTRRARRSIEASVRSLTLSALLFKVQTRFVTHVNGFQPIARRRNDMYPTNTRALVYFLPCPLSAHFSTTVKVTWLRLCHFRLTFLELPLSKLSLRKCNIVNYNNFVSIFCQKTVQNHRNNNYKSRTFPCTEIAVSDFFFVVHTHLFLLRRIIRHARCVTLWLFSHFFFVESCEGSMRIYHYDYRLHSTIVIIVYVILESDIIAPRVMNPPLIDAV